MKKERPVLWLFIAPLSHPDLCYALPTTAWVADEMGVQLECYLECERQGNLFAQTGSTVLGGHHHQQLNYLHALFDVRLLLLGEQTVFASSTALFEDEIVVQAETLEEYYAQLFALGVAPQRALYAPPRLTVEKAADQFETPELMHNAPTVEMDSIDIAPYLYPEIYFSRAIAFPTLAQAQAAGAERNLECYTLWGEEDGGQVIDRVLPQDDYGTLTLRLAKRWQEKARAVAFGDPDAIRSQLPLLCREKRVCVFAPIQKRPPREVVLAGYTENASQIAEETAQLALDIGNPILVGRQTGDADLFAWGKHGVSLQIMDPNRPAFPIVSTISHRWTTIPGTLWDDEPDDATLEKWAREGRVLSSLLFHSGEMAHNEAMLNLIDLCSVSGVKLGIGSHLARYTTCPQQWELLQIPVERGGVRGRIEPVLHSGGLGVMAEVDCPADRFAQHCREAMEGIAKIAGPDNAPRGYYFFCDTDLPTLTQTRPALYQVLQESGLQYGVSSARPGRNRLLDASIPILTQTSRTQCQGSPFVRITSQEDVRESGYSGAPGWFIGVLDAPVISFSSYIWRKGSRFMELVAFISSGRMTNVLPNTVARYALILERMGYLPARGI